MGREDRKGHSWFIWNLANIISLLRLLAPINFFVADLFLSWWDIKVKLIGYLFLFLTDAADGLIARLMGNTNGVGKLIDPAADKVLQLSGLIFLLISVPLEDWIVVPVLGGEIPIVLLSLYGIYIIVKKEIRENKIITKAYQFYRQEAKEKKFRGEKATEELGKFRHAVKYFPSEIYFKVRGRIISETKVSIFGKVKMFNYFAGVACLVLYAMQPVRFLWWGYVIMFSVGFGFCLLSYREYYQKFDRWQKEYF